MPLTDERHCTKLFFDLLLRALRASSRSDIFQRDTAVDHQFDPGDVAAFITCKIDRRPGDIPGVAAEPHWDLLVPLAPHFGDVASAIPVGEAGAVEVYSTA